MPPGVGVISWLTSSFAQGRNDIHSDITSGRVHLDVRWIDQSTNLPNGKVAHPSIIYTDWKINSQLIHVTS